MYLRVTYEDGAESVVPLSAGKVLQVYDGATNGVEVAVPLTGVSTITVEDGDLRTDESGTWVLTQPADLAPGPDAEGPVDTGPEDQADRDALLAEAGELGIELEENVSDDDLKAKIAEARADAAAEERTKEELYERAKELDIPGRSDMTKDELAAAIAEAEAQG